MLKLKMNAILLKKEKEKNRAVVMEGKERKPNDTDDATLSRKISWLWLFSCLHLMILFCLTCMNKLLWETCRTCFKDFICCILKVVVQPEGKWTSFQQHLKGIQLDIQLELVEAKVDKEEKIAIRLCFVLESWSRLLMNLNRIVFPVSTQ